MDTAALAALICATALLFAAGWRVGQEAALSLSARLVSALCSGAFGAAMIALKASAALMGHQPPGPRR